jgi:hypothetical protein
MEYAMRVKPRFRGTLIAVVGLLMFLAVFYGSENRNGSTAKTWLFISFAVGFFGGVLAFADSLAGFVREKRKRQTSGRND